MAESVIWSFQKLVGNCFLFGSLMYLSRVILSSDINIQYLYRIHISISHFLCKGSMCFRLQKSSKYMASKTSGIFKNVFKSYYCSFVLRQHTFKLEFVQHLWWMTGWESFSNSKLIYPTFYYFCFRMSSEISFLNHIIIYRST